MAEGSITIPKVGTVPKKALIVVGVGAAGFVGWKYWQARQSASSADSSTVADGEFGAVDTSIPGTLNPYPSSFYGDSSSSTSSGVTGDRNNDGVIGPGEFTTNGDWTDYVVGKLQQSDTWSYTEIVTALGLGLAGKPTTDTQQAILRAAIAVGGNPPSGSITVVGGGNTSITVAPGQVSVKMAESTATVSFGSVAGANSYQVFRSGVSSAAGAGTTSPIVVGGLTPNTSYSFQVAGVTTSGKVGPKSASVSGKTLSYNFPKAATPAITGITKTSAMATTGTVANAEEYIWFINGAFATLSGGPTYPMSGLKPGTTYRISVAARSPHQNAGPRSAERSFTTKK